MAYIKPFLWGFPRATSLWPLFLIVSIAVLNGFIFNASDDSFPSQRIQNWGFGGPLYSAEETVGMSYAFSEMPQASAKENQFFYEEGAAVGDSRPSSNLIPFRGGLKKYRVKKGDTLSSVAAEFGLTLETLRLANAELKNSSLQVGQELIILPVTGILYEVKDGDSLESVAARYRLGSDLIKQYNPDYQKLFEMPGRTVILPYAKPLPGADYVNRYVRGLPDLKNYFTLPARGWNWGELHEDNAVDIADQCGKPVYASAEGLVIPDEKLGDGTRGWNNGYGLFVLIEHPNGAKTRYAHNGKNLVKPGDYVGQSDEIALIGNTGNTHGPSGCHLHFEVYGARNPFAIR